MPCFLQRLRQSYLRSRRTWPTEFSAIVLDVFGLEPQSEVSNPQQQQEKGGVTRNAFAPREGLKKVYLHRLYISNENRAEAFAFAHDLANSARGARLHVAEVGGLAGGGGGVAGGDELVGDVAAEVGGGDAAHHAVPLNFLGGVELVAAGNPAGVEVGDPIDVFLDSADEIPFHDLHVIDVVEQLDAGRDDGLDHLHSPGGVVAHVVVVVDLAVEKLDADGDAVVLG